MEITDEIYEELNNEIKDFMIQENYEKLFIYYENILANEKNPEYKTQHKLNSFRLHKRIKNYLIRSLKGE